MIGYVKIDPSELKGKHLNLYRAVYCGLCHASSRESRFLAPFHSYDFAFLAALRLAFHPYQVKTEKRRCLPHPLKKSILFLRGGKNLRETVENRRKMKYNKANQPIGGTYHGI